MFSDDPNLGPASPCGLWRLSATDLVRLEGGGDGAPMVLAPTEQVTILTVDLPLPNVRQRLAALPFAVEDVIAEPLETVHIALGAEVAPRRHLAAVVAREIMRDWIDRISAAGFQRYVLVPDALILPAPNPGAWSVAFDEGRVLVRTEHSAFALDPGLLRDVWTAEGSPNLTTYGEGAAPLDWAAECGMPEPLALEKTLRAPPIDLRQGLFALAKAKAPLALRRLAAVAAVGIVAHLAIAAADASALRKIADKRRAEAVSLLQTAVPGVQADGDLVDRLSSLSRGGGRAGRFLPLLTRTSQAIAPLTNDISLQSLSYSDDDASLVLKVEASDLAGLERTQAALAKAGLRPTNGASSSEVGRAEGEITVRDLPDGETR